MTVIGLQGIWRTGNLNAALNVHTECEIDKASKNGTGNGGRADICYREGNRLFVWEVKSKGVAATGKKELDDYIAAMKKDDDYKGLDIVPGFDLSMPAIGYVKETNQTVVAASHPTDKGVIVYAAVEAKGPPKGVHDPIQEPATEPEQPSLLDKFRDWWHENAKWPEHNPWSWSPGSGGPVPVVPLVPAF